jgi:putative glycosyltransferase (TIGR04372 family)
LTFAKNSIHLPKTYLDSDGKYPSFFEMLKSPFGYGELSLKEYSKLGIHVVENTSDEIRDATIEMFDRISGVNIPNDREFDTKIASIRSQMPWASAGRFANSYLTKHEKTFLN